MKLAGALNPATVVHAGAEMANLRRFMIDCVWVGEIEPGGYAPNSPRLTVQGDGAHSQIQDGLWVVADYQQSQFLPNGRETQPWKMQMVCGWSHADQCYLATTADNHGHAALLHGRIEGDVLTFESAPGPDRSRQVWDASTPGAVIWRTETSLDGVNWRLVASYHCSPI